ncbi:MAG TPA: glycine betaine/L-proline ABC transporter ATP-binding protein [Atopostipes sp.]|nr:glycine betaine/L-proline ABC transporter ATP-binding protein [Atopostipes sp.]
MRSEMEEGKKVKMRVENLTKIFGDDVDGALRLLKDGKTKEEVLEETGATVGVNQASFDIYDGEIFVIMGLSGSGKSTLVRMLNRLIEPTDGAVYVDDDNINELNDEDLRELRRKKISMVFQNFGLFPHRTILENAEYGLEIQGIEKEERQKIAEEALDNSGLLPYKDQYPDQLSGGMQQRVGLARALANDPEILLMDEAFSALDPLIKRDMQDELVRLQEQKSRTIVFITHDLNEALRIADRIVIMRNGEVIQVGTGEEILDNPKNYYIQRFVQDVDRARVYTAEEIMEAPNPLILEMDTPKSALDKMDANELTNMLVIDEENHLLGYVLYDEINRAVQANKQTLDGLIRADIDVAHANTLVKDLYQIMYNAETPIAVVDRANRLRGIIVRSSILSALHTEERFEEGEAVE